MLHHNKGTNDMQRRFGALWPDSVHQVHQRVFTIHAHDNENDVLHNITSSLTVNAITVCWNIFEHGDHGVAVVHRVGTNVIRDPHGCTRVVEGSERA
jgi:chloramphenicol 3-O-phosphotransferase